MTGYQKVSKEHQQYLANLRRKEKQKRIWQISLIIVFFVLWEAAGRLGWIDPFIMSQPSRIVKSLGNLYREGSLGLHIGLTTAETLAGFFLSTVIGVAAAIALWWFPQAAKILDPYLVVLNALPKIALGPILIVWAGAGPGAIIAVAVLVTVVVTVMTSYTGFVQTDENRIHLLRSFGATKRQVFLKVVLPSNVPNLISMLKINIGLAWVGVIVGEFLVSRAGLGYLIVYGGQVFKLDLVMASIFILCVLTAIMYYAVVFVEDLVMKIWQP